MQRKHNTTAQFAPGRHRHKAYQTLILAALLCVCTGCETPSQSVPGQGSAGPFQAQYVAGLDQPELVIQNKSSRSITLELAGPSSRTIIIQPATTERLVIPSGTYTYTASAPNVVSKSGSHEFETQYRYTWLFDIVTVNR